MTRPEDICTRMTTETPSVTRPAAPAIHPASVWACDDTTQAERMLTGDVEGFVYQRDGHPNAVQFAEKCRQLHAAECAAVTSSGMAAMAAVLLSQVMQGEHIVLSNQLYGRCTTLLKSESARLGIDCTEVDIFDLAAVRAATSSKTRLIVTETIANPLLRVSDITALAEVAHAGGAKLVVDNTFATPLLCRPLELGADLVVESVSKIMNGHSDVMLGVVCGRESDWERMPLVLSAWGLASSPWDCWLALRGLSSLGVRLERAMKNAQIAAEWLAAHKSVAHVDYPGLEGHVDHQLAQRQFDDGYGHVVTFHLAEGRQAADAFIKAAASSIHFCPSLGEVSTTVSHPESTSHRGLTPDERALLGISAGTLRLSLGVESNDHVLQALDAAFAAM